VEKNLSVPLFNCPANSKIVFHSALTPFFTFVSGVAMLCVEDGAMALF
jgi:hypothetical protein